MAFRIFKRPQAERDIEECFIYIAEENLDAGISFLAAVEESLEQIARFPEIGKRIKFQNKRFQNVRLWRVKRYESYLIFYEAVEDKLEIIRVLHRLRDIPDLFQED